MMSTEVKTLELISYASGIAAGHEGCQLGPRFTRNSVFKKELDAESIWQNEITPSVTGTQQLQVVDDVARMCNEISQSVQHAIAQQHLFCTIGGDHSCAIGTWSGASHALRQQGDIGLIWIDAHMDAHTPETSESGNVHGMPLATLLGYGDTRLTHIGDKLAKLKPENVCMLGIRSYETEEQKLLEQLGVRIYYMPEIKTRGFATVLNEALQQVQQHTQFFGFSIDVDGFDAEDAPGVGTAEHHGIRARDFFAAMHDIDLDERFIGAEIAEFNPQLDKSRKTEMLVWRILELLF